MSAAQRGIVITILIAFLAGIAGVGVGRSVFNSPAPHARNLHDMVHQDLALTPAQHRQIDALETSFADRRRALELEMRSANLELAAAIREEHGYGPRVSAAVEHFHHAMGQLQIETIQHVFAMRDMLTPDQQARFDNVVSAALTEEQG